MNKEKTIFLDTSAFIPLLTENHCYHHKVRRYLGEEKFSCCIDSIVLSEYLTGVTSPENQQRDLNVIAKQFRVLSLSFMGAQIGACIFRHLKNKNAVPRGETEKQITRVDILILASAIENRMDYILYGDKHFTSMVNHINDIDIPNFSVPVPVHIQDIPGDFFDSLPN